MTKRPRKPGAARLAHHGHSSAGTSPGRYHHRGTLFIIRAHAGLDPRRHRHHRV